MPSKRVNRQIVEDECRLYTNLTEYFSTTDDSSMSFHPSARRRAPTQTLNRALSNNLRLQ